MVSKSTTFPPPPLTAQRKAPTETRLLILDALQDPARRFFDQNTPSRRHLDLWEITEKGFFAALSVDLQNYELFLKPKDKPADPQKYQTRLIYEADPARLCRRPHHPCHPFPERRPSQGQGGTPPQRYRSTTPKNQNRHPTAMKPKANTKPEPMPCFECDSGTMQPIRQNYTTTHPKLGAVTIPGVAMLCCDHCADTIIGQEGNTQIDAFLSEALNSITPAEVQQFLDKYNLSQKQASMITGLGEKNISRWLNGHSRASESISNYLRILLVDSQAFERLKQKNFTDDQNAAYPSEERQPDLKEKEILKEIDSKVLAKYGILGKSQSPKERRTLICAEFKQPNLVDFSNYLQNASKKIAAFKDTGQECSAISSGLSELLTSRERELRESL